MLLHPTLEYLEIVTWTIDATATSLSCLAHSPLHFRSKIKTLRLPGSGMNPGIKLSELCYLAVSFPDLVLLQSAIVLDFKNLPQYKMGRAADVSLSHNLKTLSIAPFDAPALSYIQHSTVARHLFTLFPALRIRIETPLRWKPEWNRWRTIGDMLQMYQTVCLDNNARSSHVP